MTEINSANLESQLGIPSTLPVDNSMVPQPNHPEITTPQEILSTNPASVLSKEQFIDATSPYTVSDIAKATFMKYAGNTYLEGGSWLASKVLQTPDPTFNAWEDPRVKAMSPQDITQYAGDINSSVNIAHLDYNLQLIENKKQNDQIVSSAWNNESIIDKLVVAPTTLFSSLVANPEALSFISGMGLLEKGIVVAGIAAQGTKAALTAGVIGGDALSLGITKAGETIRKERPEEGDSAIWTGLLAGAFGTVFGGMAGLKALGATKAVSKVMFDSVMDAKTAFNTPIKTMTNITPGEVKLLSYKDIPQKPIITPVDNTYYHGTSKPIKDLHNDIYTNEELNLYGGGLYTTDSITTARSYTNKGNGQLPTVYKINEKVSPKFLDLEKDILPNTEDYSALKNTIENKQSNSDFNTPLDIIHEKVDKNLPISSKDLKDLFKSKEYGNSAQLRTEISDSLQEQGYTGLKHLGGNIAGKNQLLHNVKIYWDPKNVNLEKITDIKLQKSTPEPDNPFDIHFINEKE